jgi:Helix-turn-helix.
MYIDKFAKNLKILIGDKSINEIAKAMGMYQQTLNRYVHSKREIGLENLCKIADYFGISLDELVGRDYY